MPKYAEGTSVLVDRSQAEIRNTVIRYGAADEFGIVERAGKAVIMFIANGKHVRFVLPLPNPESQEFRTTATGRARKGNSVNEAWEAEMRRVWRALALVIKAKFEAVASEIVSYEQEFLPFFVLPGGATVAEIMIPQLEIAYKTGKMPALLPDYSGEKR
jgi:hypothetical protein